MGIEGPRRRHHDTITTNFAYFTYDIPSIGLSHHGEGVCFSGFHTTLQNWTGIFVDRYRDRDRRELE